jgi:hypothetical protein
VVELHILAKRPGNPHEKLNFKNERVQFEFQALLQALKWPGTSGYNHAYFLCRSKLSGIGTQSTGFPLIAIDR